MYLGLGLNPKKPMYKGQLLAIWENSLVEWKEQPASLTLSPTLVCVVIIVVLLPFLHSQLHIHPSQWSRINSPLSPLLLLSLSAPHTFPLFPSPSPSFSLFVLLPLPFLSFVLLPFLFSLSLSFVAEIPLDIYSKISCTSFRGERKINFPCGKILLAFCFKFESKSYPNSVLFEIQIQFYSIG